MKKINSEILITDFKQKSSLYESCEINLRGLVEQILMLAKQDVHTISSRTKSIEALEKKIYRKDKYESLSQITDLIGVRIICYFENEIDIIADIIAKEFVIDKANSIDKRITENDRFGYKSLHYVAEFSPDRLKLTEYKSFSGLKFEIQIRSILQHSWAEIEHDIGYKSEFDIPDIAKRTFSRIAALLETADIEFVRLKSLLKNYEEETKNRLDIKLDGVTFKGYLNSSKILESQLKHLSKIFEWTGEPRFSIQPENTPIIKRLKEFNINTIRELDDLLTQNNEGLIELFDSTFKNKRVTGVNKALPVTQLLHYLDSENNSG
ncbi:GTP pyrophosphokinase [Thalassobellus suaedae]|uniref:(P)ppGpp synthetase n=1 Tax=Thalassobellus suaedae TaxID=3074124 RepID=A0ABY9XYA2_9FLAO|nr:(p)ppGpp synthetase [Flavobacteriaceae bacterium HL-DH14]